MAEEKEGQGVGIKVDVDAGKIEQMVCQAILDSALGGNMKTAIENAIAKLTNRNWQGDSPLTGLVDAKVREILKDILTEEHEETLRHFVREALTPEVVREASSAAVGAWLEKIGEA